MLPPPVLGAPPKARYARKSYAPVMEVAGEAYIDFDVFNYRFYEALPVGKMSPNIGLPLFDCSFVASS